MATAKELGLKRLGNKNPDLLMREKGLSWKRIAQTDRKGRSCSDQMLLSELAEIEEEETEYAKSILQGCTCKKGCGALKVIRRNTR